MTQDSRKREHILDATKRQLYLLSGNECALPGCSERIFSERGYIGAIAHICGVKKDAARGQHDLTNDELRDPSNLMLVCHNCHGIIDNKNNEKYYTVSRLRQIKAEHEAKFLKALGELDRLIDQTEPEHLILPTNFRKIQSFENEVDHEFVSSLAMSRAFFEKIANQGEAVRDLIWLILKRGKRETWASTRVRALSLELVAASGVSESNLKKRGDVLRAAGLLEYEQKIACETEGDSWYYSLVDPTANETLTDLFVELHRLAQEDETLLDRAIKRLDFTVFSEDS